MDLTRVFGKGSTIADLISTNRDSAILELVKSLEDGGHIASEHRDEIILALLKRESSGSTGVGCGIALPHAKTDHVDQIRGAIGISREGLDFSSPGGDKVSIVFLFLTPSRAGQEHLRLTAFLGRLIQNPQFVRRLKASRRDSELHHLLMRAKSFLEPTEEP